MSARRWGRCTSAGWCAARIGLDGRGWTRHRCTRTVQGHKALRTVEPAASDLRLWASFITAAIELGTPDPTLWVGFVRDVTADAPPMPTPDGGTIACPPAPVKVGAARLRASIRQGGRGEV